MVREESYRESLMNEIRHSGYQFFDFNIKPAAPNFTLLQDRATMYYLEDTIQYKTPIFLFIFSECPQKNSSVSRTL